MQNRAERRERRIARGGVRQGGGYRMLEEGVLRVCTSNQCRQLERTLLSLSPSLPPHPLTQITVAIPGASITWIVSRQSIGAVCMAGAVRLNVAVLPCAHCTPLSAERETELMRMLRVRIRE